MQVKAPPPLSSTLVRRAPLSGGWHDDRWLETLLKRHVFYHRVPIISPAHPLAFLSFRIHRELTSLCQSGRKQAEYTLDLNKSFLIVFHRPRVSSRFTFHFREYSISDAPSRYISFPPCAVVVSVALSFGESSFLSLFFSPCHSPFI